MGFQGNFYWWEGVVEDNLDPLGIGRCRVRIIGHHSGDKTFLPTEELPWAYPILPVNNQPGKIVALKPGTRVFGFSRDGESCQDLVVIGTMNTGFENPPVVGDKPGGFKEEDLPMDTSTVSPDVPRFGMFGFTDDRKRTGDNVVEGNPKKTIVTMDNEATKSSFQEVSDYYPLESGANEVNVPRLARGNMVGTISYAHLQSQAEISVPSTGTQVTEPQNPYDALYPFNTVEESDSGHVKEVDDTPGAERIKETHRTGTFYEIHPDGTKVTKVVKDDFSVTIGDKGVKVQGICAVHVVGKADFYCEEDIYVKTDKTARVVALKDAHVNAIENITATAGKDVTATAGKDVQVSGAGHVAVVSGGDMSISAGGEITFADSSATASNVDEIIKDIVDGQGGASIRVDSGA
jgi:hypothetical protein